MGYRMRGVCIDETMKPERIILYGFIVCSLLDRSRAVSADHRVEKVSVRGLKWMPRLMSGVVQK
jgi:uncharacterized Rossmann fold enzyme